MFFSKSFHHLCLPQVEFIMPKDASDHMQRQIAQGSDGIDEVIEAISQVDSEEAKAWSIQDEIKVKLITQWDDSMFLTPQMDIRGDSCASLRHVEPFPRKSLIQALEGKGEDLFETDTVTADTAVGRLVLWLCLGRVFLELKNPHQVFACMFTARR